MFAVLLRWWQAFRQCFHDLVKKLRQHEPRDEEWEPDPDTEKAWRQHVDRLHVGSGVGWEYQPSTGRRRLVVYDRDALKAGLGERTLWAFTRSFVGVDRLLAISRLQNLAIRHHREAEQWALLWVACGTIRELLKAVDALNGAGIKRHLTGDALVAWKEVRTILDRWRRDPIYVRVRNTLAFHFDEERALFDAGMLMVAAERIPLYLTEGYEGKVQRFPFAQLIMLGGLFPNPATRGHEFRSFVKGVRHAQARLVGLLYRVLVAALKTAAPGLSVLQLERANFLAVLKERYMILFWESLKEEDDRHQRPR